MLRAQGSLWSVRVEGAVFVSGPYVLRAQGSMWSVRVEGAVYVSGPYLLRAQYMSVVRTC